MFLSSVLIHPNTKQKSVLKPANVLLAIGNISSAGVTNPNAHIREAGNINERLQLSVKTMSIGGYGKLESKYPI